MKGIKDLVLLGDSRLYEYCQPVGKDEGFSPLEWKENFQNTVKEFREKFGFGRAIAAPQLGLLKRVIFMNTETPEILINPEILFQSEEMFEVWDNCMSFPNLEVLVKRHKEIQIKYLDENWETREKQYQNDLSELFQHEFDHLNGILCIQRAIDPRAFRWSHPLV